MEAQDSAVGLLSLLLPAVSLWTLIIAVFTRAESKKKILHWLGRRTN